MADMHCMFLHQYTPSTNADEALLKEESSEFNHLQIIAVHMLYCYGVFRACVCVYLCASVSPVKRKASKIHCP